jgi:hypothetical protein
VLADYCRSGDIDLSRILGPKRQQQPAFTVKLRRCNGASKINGVAHSRHDVDREIRNRAGSSVLRNDLHEAELMNAGFELLHEVAQLL